MFLVDNIIKYHYYYDLDANIFLNAYKEIFFGFFWFLNKGVRAGLLIVVA